MLVACVPAALSVRQLIHLQSGIAEIERDSSVTTLVSNVADIVVHSLTSFTAITLDLSADEQAKVLGQTDQQFIRLKKAVTDLRSSASTFVSKQQNAALTEAIEDIAHSWEEIREQTGKTLVAAEKTYHFLKIFAQIRNARRILTTIERHANGAAKAATALSFERIEQANILLICVLVGAALIGLIAIFGNHQFAHSMQRSNEHLDAALSNMSSGLCMFDGNQRLAVCNERYASIYGLASDLLKPGTTFRQILEYRVSNETFAGDTQEDYFQERLTAVLERNPSTKIQQLSGGRFVEISHCPMLNGAWLATHEDVTDRVNAEAELIRHRDHLQDLVNEATVELKTTAEELELALVKEKDLNKLQRQFVSMVSHEFRTPLTIIDGTAQWLESRADRLTPEEAAKRAGKIRDAVKRMTRLMDSTLTAARMEEGKITVEIGSCDVGRIVREVCARQQEIAEGHAISCDLLDLPETVQADADALELVFTNLLSNAVKYAPHASDIEVKACVEGKHVVISVRDHGLGIDDGDLPRIFERFFRAKTSTGIAGTGIGLNLVKTLVEMHGGSVRVESKVSEGSVFTVQLPIQGPVKALGSDSKAA